MTGIVLKSGSRRSRLEYFGAEPEAGPIMNQTSIGHTYNWVINKWHMQIECFKPGPSVGTIQDGLTEVPNTGACDLG